MTIDKRLSGYFADVTAARDDIRQMTESLRQNGGGGTSGGMDGWQQSVETRLADLGTDVRDLRRWFGGGVVLILGAFAAGFLALQAEIRESDKLTRHEISAVNQRLDGISQSQVRVETLLTERSEKR
ncbi:hypothetical protein [Brevundimonas diminuta]|uniref:hypothetical protein n=1 Tax=Brevundimonas diminuta TaxID=293 RepID=UPI0030F87487